MKNYSNLAFATVPAGAHCVMPSRREGFLADMERTVPWSRLHALVEPIYCDPQCRHDASLELDRMLRIYFLQRWYRLTDGAVREAICDSSAMRSFVREGMTPDAAPDEESIRTFRQVLQEYGLGEVIMQAVDRHLRALGLAVAPGAIVDPTVISNNAHSQVPYARVIDTRSSTIGATA